MTDSFRDRLMKSVAALRVNGIELSVVKIAKVMGTSRRTVVRTLEGRYLVRNSCLLPYISNLAPSTTGLPILTTTNIHPLCSREGGQMINSSAESIGEEVGAVGVLLGGMLLPIPVTKLDYIDLKEYDMPDILQTILNGILVQNKLLNSNTKFETRSLYSTHILKCLQEISRSDSLYSQSPHFKYLDQHDKGYVFSKLFERYGNYIVGISNYKYRFTDLAKDVIFPQVLEKLAEIPFNEVVAAPSDILCPKSVMKDVKPQDMFYMLSLCRGEHDGCYVIANEVQDVQHSRKYSVMTSISSKTRTLIGYVGYDISACLQTIALGKLDRKKFPLHGVLMHNKKLLREFVLMQKLEKTLPQIKTILSASDNGKQYKGLRTKSKMLNRYLNESETLADDFNQYMKDEHPDRYKLAHNMAKHEWVKTGKYDAKTGKPKWKKSKDKNKYSLFFFCWTQIERDIRDIMIEAVGGDTFVHEVHDAIYIHNTAVNPDIDKMEQKILSKLSLHIKIESA